MWMGHFNVFAQNAELICFAENVAVSQQNVSEGIKTCIMMM
jgi:hypothetical protein